MSLSSATVETMFRGVSASGLGFWGVTVSNSASSTYSIFFSSACRDKESSCHLSVLNSTRLHSLPMLWIAYITMSCNGPCNHILSVLRIDLRGQQIGILQVFNLQMTGTIGGKSPEHLLREDECLQKQHPASSHANPRLIHLQVRKTIESN